MTSAERAKAWREANPNRERENHRKWVASNKERNDARIKAWRESHQEELRTWAREYAAKRRSDPDFRAKQAAYLRDRYHADAENQRERVRRWAKENPEKTRIAANRYRSRKVNAEGDFSAEEFADLCQQFDHCCAYCGDKTKLCADHVIPLVRGGSNTIENILPACRPCNSSKGPLTDAEFLARTG